MSTTKRISFPLWLLAISSWLFCSTEGHYIRQESRENAPIDNLRVNPTPDDSDSKALYHRNLYDIHVTPPAQGDLGLRFTKIVFQDPTVDVSRLPLSRSDYPINMETALWLAQSQCPSVTIPDNCSECQGIDFAQLVQDIAGPPSHPGMDGYWEDLLEVAVVQEQRKNGTDVHSVMPLPDIWEGYDLEDVAIAVHNEYPGSIHQELIQYLLSKGATVDSNAVPQHCNAEFLRGVVMLAHLNAWAMAKVGPVNFGVKYFEGRARPEEIAYMISTRKLNANHGVTDELLAVIPQGSLDRAVNFTAYPEGSPMHPSWPSMHSAASVGSTWLAVVMNLTPAQHCQAKLVDYAIAYARTVAGVHYASDNMAGLKLGQKIMEEKLPAYLAEMYGSDPDLVRAKIKEVHFEWDEFLESNCYKNHMM